jgi:hypothetical protein
MSLLKNFSTLFFTCLLLTACTTMEVGLEARATTTSIVPGATSTATALPVTPTPILATPIAPPEVNQFYLGTLLGQPVLFVRSPNNQSDFVGEPYLGMVRDEKGYGQSPFDLRQIDFPRPVFLNSEATSFDFKLDAVTDRLYLSLYIANPDRPDFLKNPILEIDPKTSAQRQVWFNETSQDKYPGYKGGAQIDQAVGGFLALKLNPCFACDSAEPRPTLMVNTTTGTERLLGLVGDVRLKVDDKAAEYRKLEPTRQKCEPNPICGADGYMTIYEPAGEVIVEPLP